MDASQPRVFVSSTIYDFRDLRSALKFWLEELGLEVRMSEFNDFARRPDQATFESCFGAIEDCDYYILLVGGRKGSDYQPGVSVTQQEYRVAANLARQGRIKPVIFVRDEVQTALRERRTIGKALEDVGLNSDSATQTRSSALEDPEFIRAFLQEIDRTEFEREGSPEPAGTMWRYSFAQFADLADALRVNLSLERSIRKQALLANVKWELEANIAALCRKKSGVLEPHTNWLGPTREAHPLTADVVDDFLGLSATEANDTYGFWAFAPGGDKFRSVALGEAILSGEFLVYQQANRRLAAGRVYESMQLLLSAIKAYQEIYAIIESRHEALGKLYLSVRGEQGAQVWCGDLVWLYGLYDRMQDILRLSLSLLRYILMPSKDLKMPTLNAISPLAGEADKVVAEQPSHEDVERWASDETLAHLLSGERPATPQQLVATIAQSPAAMEVAQNALSEQLRPYLAEYQMRKQTEGEAEAVAWLQAKLKADLNL